MSRLPSVGADNGTWGTVLNDFLSVSHNANGTINPSALPTASTSTAGIVQLASTTDATTGTDTTKAVTAVGVKAVGDTKANLSHTHAGSDITSGTIAATYLPSSTTSAAGVVQLATVAQTITGTDATKAVTPAGMDAALIVNVGPVTLTDAATIATDASLSNYFRVTMLGNRTLGIPTNPSDGQKVLWELTASGGARTLIPTTGSTGAFKFGTDFTTIPTIASGTTTFIGAIYRSSTTRWHIISLAQGH